MDTTVIAINVVGWLGMGLLVGAYALVTMGKVLGTSLAFQVMNLFGGFFLMLNSAYYGAWPSAGLNVVWMVVGLVGLVRAGLRPPNPSGPRTL